jgi:hypothetical protein
MLAPLPERTRSNQSTTLFRTGAMQMPKMPAIYISKYNRFVDNIITRINRMLGKSYDPVRVKLPSNESKKTKNTTKKRKSNPKKRKNNTRRTTGMTNKMAEIAIARSTESESREPTFVLISKNSESKPTVRQNSRVENRATNTKNKKKKNNNNKNKNNKNKANEKKTAKAKATLFGLSSIKRDGDVSVNMMADHTTVKTNFILGPLTLRVEREVKIDNRSGVL